jgi:hypothetical protein
VSHSYLALRVRTALTVLPLLCGACQDSSPGATSLRAYKRNVPKFQEMHSLSSLYRTWKTYRNAYWTFNGHASGPAVCLTPLATDSFAILILRSSARCLLRWWRD